MQIEEKKKKKKRRVKILFFFYYLNFGLFVSSQCARHKNEIKRMYINSVFWGKSNFTQ